jgi:3-(3-hydroxy-phenyl)propionate hydroxylase
MPQAVRALAGQGVAVLEISPDADPHGQAYTRYGLPDRSTQALVLVRPDGYVLGRWLGLSTEPVVAAMKERGLA